MTQENPLRPDDARDALSTVSKMESAGFGRAMPSRWYGLGIALVVTLTFFLYVMEDPGSLPGVFITIGVVLFVAFHRSRSGAIGKELPDTSTGVWTLIGICIFLLMLFFGGIYLRRAYDLSWIPLLTGMIAGMTIYLLSESERRYYLQRSKGGAQE